LGCIGGWLLARSSSETRVDRVVALSWENGPDGRVPYGAHVYLEPLDEGGYSVRARVNVGRGNAYFAYYQNLGELGRVATEREAVERWGQVAWREDGLQVGTGPGARFLPRHELENHR